MAGSAGSLGSGLLNIQSASRQKSREMKDSSDSDDDELFDGEKLKTKLMSMWNNMRHGQEVDIKYTILIYIYSSAKIIRLSYHRRSLNILIDLVDDTFVYLSHRCFYFSPS